MLFKKWREAAFSVHRRFVVIHFSLVLNHPRQEPYSFSLDKVNNREQNQQLEQINYYQLFYFMSFLDSG